MSTAPSAFDGFCVADVLAVKAGTATRTSVQLERTRTNPPCSVVAVDINSSLRDNLEELELSLVKSLPIKDQDNNVVGFFSADLALRECLAVAGDPELERDVLEKTIGACLDTRLDSGQHGDGGTLPFTFGDMPLR